MRKLPRPVDHNNMLLNAGEVFDTCISRVRNPGLRARLQGIRPLVVGAAANYDALAAAMQLNQIAPQNNVGPVTCKEMNKVYTSRMVGKKSPGRDFYDALMSIPRHRKCPFCGLGTANSLDHYLPKTKFPALSVVPDNLVACCMWCQKEKDAYFPTTPEDQLLHPYFDDWSFDTWLAAEVVQEPVVGYRYYSAPPENWDQTSKRRLAKHLKELKLPELFASNAGGRMAEFNSQLSRLFEAGGAEAVREHLTELLVSSRNECMNSWTTAMFRASVDSDWFCSGGFRAFE